MAASRLALLPGALMIYLGYSGGGYFPPAVAVGVAVLAVALVLRLTLAQRPLEGFGLPSALVAAALALFVVWTLVSSGWSDAPGRAVLEFDRALLYLMGFVLVASLPRSPETARWLLFGIVAGAAVVCIGGLLTRILPEVFPISPNVLDQRLSYPVTYWNALGLLAAVGIVASTHLTCSVREPPVVRATGAALVPLLTATLYFTFSRASIAVAVAGVLGYLLVARPRGLVPGFLAALPPSVAGVLVSYGAGQLAKADPTTPGAVDEGHGVALVLLLCVLAAAGTRLLMIRLGLDGRLAALEVSRKTFRAAAGFTAVTVALALAASWFAFDLGERIDRQYDRFTEGDVISQTDDARDRLTEVGNNGRIDHWDEAVDAWHHDELKGTGAGTYELTWAQNRPAEFTVRDGHSLYLETLSELGMVGAGLLGLVLGAFGLALLALARGPDRGIWAALLVALLVWGAHAAQDWDWEMPAVTLWVFAAGGAALAQADGGLGLPRLGRVIAALVVLALAVTPIAAGLSHSRLQDAVRAFKAGNCNDAVDDALAANSALSARAEPYVILAYCDVRLGKPALAERMMLGAIDRDPENWEYHYGLGLVRAAGGEDPRGDIRRAHELNPKEPLAILAAEAFAETNDPRTWRRRALEARLPIN